MVKSKNDSYIKVVESILGKEKIEFRAEI